MVTYVRIKNTGNKLCRNCGEVHEYYTNNCMPFACEYSEAVEIVQALQSGRLELATSDTRYKKISTAGRQN